MWARAALLSFVGLAGGLWGLLPSTATSSAALEMAPLSDSGFGEWLESAGATLSTQQVRTLFQNWRRLLMPLKKEWSADSEAECEELGRGLAREFIELAPSVYNWSEAVKLELLERGLRGVIRNYSTLKFVLPILSKRGAWRSVSEGWLDALLVMDLEEDIEDSFVFGGEDDDEAAEPPKKKPRASSSGPPLGSSEAGTKGRKRKAESEPEGGSAAKSPRRSTFGDWLEKTSQNPLVPSWLGLQTAALGRSGFYGPMVFSELAFLFSAAASLKALSETAANQVLAIFFGALGLSSGFGDSVEDVCSGLLWLGFFAVGSYLFGDIAAAWASDLFSKFGSAPPGPGGPGAPSGPSAGSVEGAPSPAGGVVPPGDGAGGGAGLGIAEPTSETRAPGAASAADPSGVSDFARRLGLSEGLGNRAPIRRVAETGTILPPSDERVLPIESQSGERWRSWDSVLRTATGPKDPQWGAHLRGSATAMETFRGYRAAGGPLGHHREWLKCVGNVGRPHAHEHYALSAVLEMLACFDQVNVGSLMGIELLMRRLQLLESAYETGKGKPDFGHSADVMGFLSRESGAVISGTLEAEITERLKTRAEIAKQLSKAREVLPRGPKKTADKS